MLSSPSPTQGLSGIKAFFGSPSDSVQSVLYTFPPTLTSVLRGCVREQVQIQEKTTAVKVLWLSTMSYLSVQ